MVRWGGSDLDPTDPAPVVSVRSMYKCLPGVSSIFQGIRTIGKRVARNGGSTLDPTDPPPVVGFSGSWGPKSSISRCFQLFKCVFEWFWVILVILGFLHWKPRYWRNRVLTTSSPEGIIQKMRLIAKLLLPNLRRALKTTLRVFPKSSGYILTVLERFEQVEFLYVYRYLRNRGTEDAGPRILKHHKTPL